VSQYDFSIGRSYKTGFTVLCCIMPFLVTFQPHRNVKVYLKLNKQRWVLVLII
jgi:hypothetical protein